MADDAPTISTARIPPGEVARRSFGTVRRGFDPEEVRAFLEVVARELLGAERREQELLHDLADAEERARHPVIDEGVLTSSLGQRSAAVLRSAHEEAARIVQGAEESAATLLHQAQQQATETAVRAESAAAERIAEAELAANALRQQSRDEAAAVLEAARADADSVAERARDHGRSMLEQAQEARRRVLADMAARRRAVTDQIEQFRAARDEVAASVLGVRQSLDRIVDELGRADDAARAAASEAARHQGSAVSDADLVEEAERAASELGFDTGASLSAALLSGALETGRSGAIATESRREHYEPGDGADRAGDVLPATDLRDAAGAIAEGPLAGEPRYGEGVDDLTGGPERRAVAAPGAPGGTAADPATGSPAPAGTAGPAGGERGTRAERGGAAAGNPARPAGSGRRRAEVVLRFDDFGSATGEHAAGAHAGGSTVAGPFAGIETEEDEAQSADVEDLFARLRAQADEAPTTLEQPAVPSSRAEAPPSPGPGAGSAPAGGPTVAADARDDAGAAGGGRADAEAGADAEGADAERADAEAEPPEPSTPEEAALERRGEALEPIVSTMARRLKRALQDDQNRLLDRLRKGTGEWSDDLLLDVDAQRALYAKAGSTALRDAVAAGISYARSASGARQGRAPSPDAQTVEAVTEELAATVVALLRRRLEGAELPDAAERIGAAYREWRGERIERLAEDRAIEAFSAGVLAGVAKGVPVRWVHDERGPGCADCEDNALAGSLDAGEEFPTGHHHPPAHAGCRCLVVPTPA